MPVSPLWVLNGYGPMSTRLTSGDATDALNRSSRGELEGWIMGKTAREGVASHSSAHKQIAHGSTRARLASDTSARIAMPRRLARHQLRERLDRPRRHTQLHLYHLSLRRAQVTNTCCISSPSWTLSLCCRQSSGSQEDWIADMRRFDFKPWIVQCKQQKPTQQLQSKGCGAKWPSAPPT